MTTRPLPPALEPYLRLPPEASLILLTSTLGCSVNWLTCRFISSTLNSNAPDEVQTKPSVILISWLRDLAFWKPELKRTTGLDISRHPKTFTFIDAFSTSISLSEIQKSFLSSEASDRNILLILDTPSLLVATTPTTPNDLNTFILNLRSRVHSCIITSNADLSLLQDATPIEAATANFLTMQVHAARLVMSVRELSTGAARDVSGVLRITRGGDWDESEAVAEERELLYFVQRDGNVRVFNRGE